MEDPRNYILVLLEEYKSLREESKQASINMFTSLQWGAAVLGVIIAAAFTQWGKQDAVVLLTFYIIVPVLSATAMFLWLGEATRFKRAGDYICLIEQKAGMILDDLMTKNEVRNTWEAMEPRLLDSLGFFRSDLNLSDPLTWEQWLKNMKGKSPAEGHISWIYKIRFGFFILLMVVSFFIAVYYTIVHLRFLPQSWRGYLLHHLPEPYIKVLVLSAFSFVFITVTVAIAYKFAKHLDVGARPFRRDKSAG